MPDEAEAGDEQHRIDPFHVAAGATMRPAYSAFSDCTGFDSAGILLAFGLFRQGVQRPDDCAKRRDPFQAEAFPLALENVDDDAVEVGVTDRIQRESLPQLLIRYRR